MRYTYTVFIDDDRKDVCTRFEEVVAMLTQADEATGDPLNFYVSVSDNMVKKDPFRISDWDALEEWQTTLAREAAWKPAIAVASEQASPSTEAGNACSVELFKKMGLDPALTKYLPDPPKMTLEQLKPKDHVNPSHYQSIFSFRDVELQWLEMVQCHKRYRNPEIFKGAVEMQVRKYLDRLGGKDKEAQELLKALWYLKYLIAYILNDSKPVLVSEIDELISKA